MAKVDDFKSPPCRVSYAQNLFEARAVEEGGKKKFGCTLIFEAKDKGELEKILAQAITAEWGDKGLERARSGLIKSPILAGDGKEARNKTTGEIHPGLGADKVFIRVSSLYEPQVRYKSANVPAKYGAGPDEIKSGDYGFAVLNAFAWNNPKSGDGVSFGIQYFQKTRDGESLGGTGGVDVDKYFEKIADTGAAPAAAQTGAGAGGLFG
jgi:hypothetical protein